MGGENHAGTVGSKDMLKKLDLYKQCGVKEYWIVDPKNEQVQVYSLKDNGITDSKAFRKGADTHVKSDYSDGLQVSLDDMFSADHLT